MRSLRRRGSPPLLRRLRLAVLLASVVAGATADSNVLASAELDDPQPNGWATGADKPPDMSNPRARGILILLPYGKVLVAGGYADNSGPTPPLTSAELYDPQTNTWTNGG